MLEYDVNLENRRPEPHKERATKLWLGLDEPTQSKAIKRNLTPSEVLPVDYPLSAEQLAAANLLLDFSDNRSQAAKLKAIGVSTQRYTAWLRQPAFSGYLRERAEGLINNAQHEAHTSLLRAVQNGRMDAIKYYNEITGRYNPKDQEALNLTAILVKVVEILQIHVKEPEVLRAVAKELGELLPHDE
jgi:hypothetical protein